MKILFLQSEQDAEKQIFKTRTKYFYRFSIRQTGFKECRRSYTFFGENATLHLFKHYQMFFSWFMHILV